LVRVWYSSVSAIRGGTGNAGLRSEHAACRRKYDKKWQELSHWLILMTKVALAFPQEVLAVITTL
jgi:hypothetical protein